MVLNHRSKNGVSRIIDQKMELADASHTRRRPDAGVDIFQPPPPLVTRKSRRADKTHRLVKRADCTDEGTRRRATMYVSPTRWIDLSAAESRSGEARANGWGVPNFIKTIMSFVMFKQIV